MKKTAAALAVSAALAASLGRADVVEQGPKDSPPSGLLAGVARANITPPVGIAQLNWGSQTHVEAVGIDPVGLYATALEGWWGLPSASLLNGRYPVLDLLKA